MVFFDGSKDQHCKHALSHKIGRIFFNDIGWCFIHDLYKVIENEFQNSRRAISGGTYYKVDIFCQLYIKEMYWAGKS